MKPLINFSLIRSIYTAFTPSLSCFEIHFISYIWNNTSRDLKYAMFWKTSKIFRIVRTKVQVWQTSEKLMIWMWQNCRCGIPSSNTTRQRIYHSFLTAFDRGCCNGINIWWSGTESEFEIECSSVNHVDSLKCSKIMSSSAISQNLQPIKRYFLSQTWVFLLKTSDKFIWILKHVSCLGCILKGIWYGLFLNPYLTI